MVADKDNRVMAEEEGDGILMSFFYYEIWKVVVPRGIKDPVGYMEDEFTEEKALDGLEKYEEELINEYNGAMQKYTSKDLEEFAESEELYTVTYDPPGFYEMKTDEAKIEKVGDNRFKLHFTSSGKGYINLESNKIKEVE